VASEPEALLAVLKEKRQHGPFCWTGRFGQRTSPTTSSELGWKPDRALAAPAVYAHLEHAMLLFRRTAFEHSAGTAVFDLAQYSSRIFRRPFNCSRRAGEPMAAR
jgi:hypothetical protein